MALQVGAGPRVTATASGALPDKGKSVFKAAGTFRVPLFSPSLERSFAASSTQLRVDPLWPGGRRGRKVREGPTVTFGTGLRATGL